MNFKKVNLPSYDLYSELTGLFSNNVVNFAKENNQICLNTVKGYENNYLFGAGSLTKDWSKHVKYKINGIEKTHVPRKKEIYNEEDFTILCDQFKGTLFEKAYNDMSSVYKLGRVRIMRSPSRTCLSWHTDVAPRLHYPIKTQEGCFMIIEDEVKFLEPNTWWMTDTLKYHTAVNASTEDRIHLVATILGER